MNWLVSLPVIYNYCLQKMPFLTDEERRLVKNACAAVHENTRNRDPSSLLLAYEALRNVPVRVYAHYSNLRNAVTRSLWRILLDHNKLITPQIMSIMRSVSQVLLQAYDDHNYNSDSLDPMREQFLLYLDPTLFDESLYDSSDESALDNQSCDDQAYKFTRDGHIESYYT